MEKRTVTLRETAMKAVPSNREVTEAVLRLRDGPSERGTLITQERGGPFSAAVTLLAQTLGINELWACVFFHCQGCPIQSLFFSKFWLHLVFVVACGLSCPAACGILILRPGTEPVSPVLNSSSSSFFFFLIFIWLCQVLGHAGSFSC